MVHRFWIDRGGPEDEWNGSLKKLGIPPLTYPSPYLFSFFQVVQSHFVGGGGIIMYLSIGGLLVLMVGWVPKGTRKSSISLRGAGSRWIPSR